MRNWDELYVRDGHFRKDGMTALVQEVIERGRPQGFPLTRLVAHAEWIVGNWPVDWIELEARPHYVLPQYKDPFISNYDLAKFGGSILIDVIRTHPMIIMGGVVQENPFFCSPGSVLAGTDATQRQPS